jgi:hypothetical protein
VVVLTSFVMFGCFDNCVDGVVICVLAITMFSIICTVSVLFIYIYSYLFCLY